MSIKNSKSFPLLVRAGFAFMQKFDHKPRQLMEKYSTHPKSIAPVKRRCYDQRFRFVVRRKYFRFK